MTNLSLIKMSSINFVIGWIESYKIMRDQNTDLHQVSNQHQYDSQSQE